MIGFDFGDCGPIEWNSKSSQPSGKSVLRQWRPKEVTCRSNSFSDNVLYSRAFAHMVSLPLKNGESVLK